MTARISLILGKTRGHRPRLQKRRLRDLDKEGNGGDTCVSILLLDSYVNLCRATPPKLLTVPEFLGYKLLREREANNAANNRFERPARHHGEVSDVRDADSDYRHHNRAERA